MDRIRSNVDTKQAHVVLVPSFLMMYQYNNKSYHVCFNAINGLVEGTRPYSPIKIGLAVAGAAIGAAGIAVYLDPTLLNLVQ